MLLVALTHRGARAVPPTRCQRDPVVTGDVKRLRAIFTLCPHARAASHTAACAAARSPASTAANIAARPRPRLRSSWMRLRSSPEHPTPLRLQGGSSLFSLHPCAHRTRHASVLRSLLVETIPCEQRTKTCAGVLPSSSLRVTSALRLQRATAPSRADRSRRHGAVVCLHRCWWRRERRPRCAATGLKYVEVPLRRSTGEVQRCVFIAVGGVERGARAVCSHCGRGRGARRNRRGVVVSVRRCWWRR